MQSITSRIGRHDMVLDIRIDNVCDSLVDLKQGNLLNQSQGIGFLRKVPILQFVDDGFTRHKLKLGAAIVPPFARPCASRQHFRLRADLVVEAGYRSLDINATIHVASLLTFGSRGSASFAHLSPPRQRGPEADDNEAVSWTVLLFQTTLPICR